MEKKAKRARTQNFTLDEKVLLVNIVGRKYKDIVENKKTDSVTATQKNEAWEEISEEFNNTGIYVFRSKEILKRMYENKKKELRKTVAAEKRENFKTGGGLPECVPKKDPCDEILLSIMNKKSVYGMESVYDSDSLHINEENIEFIIDENDEIDLDEVCV